LVSGLARRGGCRYHEREGAALFSERKQRGARIFCVQRMDETSPGSTIGRKQPLPTEVYEDHGVRFEYPSGWTAEVTDEGPVTTIDLQHPDGVAFALVRTDELRPDPTDVSEEALEAMRAEYPDLDAFPVVEMLSDHRATGHDVEFFSLDVTNAARIRCFRTPRRTVLVFGQWSDIGPEDLSEPVVGVIRSLEEFDD
jgi:hypothetical protein